MKSIARLALGLAIAGAATLTFAQATPPAAGKRASHHAKIDANGDGVIDRSEAAKAPKFAEQFDKLDANKDGRITAEERPQRGMRDGKGGQGGRDAMRGRMQEMDTDKDGRFSRAELAGRDRILQNFGAIDSNKDGMLSREEMHAYHKTHRGQGGAQRPQN
jgi:Ca2+-binding EF-hand superfamily protein